MATRKKSFNDVVRQYNRIEALRDELSTRDGRAAAADAFDAQDYVDSYNRGASRANARADKAFEIASKYIRNITKSKSYQNIKGKALQLDENDREPLRNKAHNRKYSQRTYMGGNAG